MIRFLGALFAGRHQHLSAAADLSRAIHEKTIKDLDAKLYAALEDAAAERLRNADLTRRLAASVDRLDRNIEREKEAIASAERLQAEVDRKSAMPGDHRYWEGRYRDEAAQNEALREQITRMQADCDAATEIDEAWAASPYPDNRKHLSLAEQMSSLDTELESLRDENSRLIAAVANAEMDGPKRTLEKENDAQAARAMSRNTKQHFVAYQHAVKMILDKIDALGQKNHITKEDLRKLRLLRDDLSAQINRTI